MDELVMDELVFQVTRDSLESENGEERSIGIWDASDVLYYDETPSWKGMWLRKHDTNNEPLRELTPQEFEEQYYVDAPKPGEKIWIATYCKWEKVDFDD